MKLKSKSKKIIAISLFIMLIGSAFIGNFNTVYGEINEIYGSNQESGTIDLDQASGDSTILELVGHFIYAIAGFVESVVSSLIGNFTGSDIFPWADKIIFNTIPFLDVNFINPSDGSMFRNISGIDTIFGSIIKNIYNTIFTLAIAFFGVVVGIMALKLAISSIASEKAKYKQAITNWLLALILLFTAHYLMSFIFFINEKMVEVASSIFMTQLNNNEDNINLNLNVDNDPSKLTALFNKMFEAYYNANGKDEDVYNLYNIFSGDDDKLIKLVTVYESGSESDFHYKFFIDHTYDYKNDMTQFQFNGTGAHNWNNVNSSTTSLDSNLEQLVTNKFKSYLSILLSNSEYIEDYRSELADMIDSTTGWFHELDFGDLSARRDFRRIINDTLFLVNSDIEVKNILGYDIASPSYYCQEMARMERGGLTNGNIIDDALNEMNNDNYGNRVEEILSDIKNMTNSTSDTSKNEIIYNLSDYFKRSIYISSINLDADYDEGEELVNVKFQPIVAILYAIFIIQSLMYFIAYMKRFFYIVVLSLFAPLVVIYDFLTKSAM